MTIHCKPLFFAAILYTMLLVCLSAQERPAQTREENSSRIKPLAATRKHPVAITACAQGAGMAGNAVFFFGDNAGFLSMHRVLQNEQNGRAGSEGAVAGFSSIMEGIWQVSDLPIKMIAVHPAGNLVAVYESDSFSAHRVSLWNWAEKRRVYAKRFQDSINDISWSASGTYLMVANTSFNGITFLQGEAGETVMPFNSPPGIVNLSVTGKSERSVVNYAPAGRIVYTSLESGETIEECLTEPNLFATSLCNNNRTIIGFTESSSVAVNALDGSVLSAFDAKNPIAATSISDTEPVWFERASGRWVLRQGGLDAEPVSLPAGEEILAAAGAKNFRIFGTSTGDIYVFAAGSATREETAPLAPVTGICAASDFFYFIAKGSLYRSGEYGEEPVLLLSSPNGKEKALFGSASSVFDSSAPFDEGSLLLWSSEAVSPLLRFNKKTGETTRLYTPQRGITSLSVTASGIALVEGNSRAVSIGNGGTAPFVYSGLGLQDAVMVSSDRMLIAKSADTRSSAPLTVVDVTTGETVPLNFSADICFSLAPVSGREDLLYAYAATAGNGQDAKSTELVLIKLNAERPSQSEIETVAVYSDEDLSAKLHPLSADQILATLGKTALSEIQRQDSRQRLFERAYALPEKIAAAGESIVTLNRDGSLTWYTTSGRATGNLALSLSGEWLWDGARAQAD